MGSALKGHQKSLELTKPQQVFAEGTQGNQELPGVPGPSVVAQGASLGASVPRGGRCALTRSSYPCVPKACEAIWWQRRVRAGCCCANCPAMASSGPVPQSSARRALPTKLTSRFPWGSHVEGAHDAPQLSSPDNS